MLAVLFVSLFSCEALSWGNLGSFEDQCASKILRLLCPVFALSAFLRCFCGGAWWLKSVDSR